MRRTEIRVLDQATESAFEVAVPVGRFGVHVFARTELLITLGRDVNVKITERHAFDRVRMFMGPAVVAPKAKPLA